MKHKVKQTETGFSLIELMIAVAIVGILASIAYPSYQEHVMSTRRSVAALCMMEVAAEMEAIYAANLTYVQRGNPALDRERFWPLQARGRFQCLQDPVVVDNYFFRFTNEDNWTYRNSYTAILFVNGRGAQAGDICQVLQIDQTGQRTVFSRGVERPDLVDQCW